jgi:ATP-dependent DNA helicase RecG
MQNLNLKRPEIIETPSAVLVRLAHEPLASKEEIIKKHLQSRGTINNTVAREICNVASDSVIRKIFSQMIDAGEIEKVPGTAARGTKYRLRNAFVTTI